MIEIRTVDQLHVDGTVIPLRIRSMVGLLPLIACEVLEQDIVDRLPGFKKRMAWFLANRPDEADQIACMLARGDTADKRLLAIPGVVGVYVGLLSDGRTPCLKVMLARKTPENERAIPRTIEGYSVVTEVTGEIRPFRNP